MLKRPDGRIAHVESEYNDIYVTKRRGELTMSFQLKGWDYTESVTNLRDPDDLVLRYAQVMTIATIYPGELKKILMLGLGGGSISTYLGRFMPEVAIDTVEIDRRVIEVAKTYFGLRETERVRYLDGDGRVFLNRNKEPLRPDPARRLSRRLRAVPSADQGILYAGQAAAHARRRRRLQRP